MNKKITLLGIIVFFISGTAYADIGIIAPYHDSNCDQYFDNQSLVFDPVWKNMERSASVLTIFATYLAKYTIGNFTDEDVEILELDTPPKKNNLYCFNAPKLREASRGGVPLPATISNTKELMMAQRRFSNIKTNATDRCCFVLLSTEPPLIKA